MRSASMQIGTHGEDMALAYLRSHGYTLYARNVRVRRDEIDLIMFDSTDRTLVFVEVKTRSTSDPDFLPHLNLTPAKRRKLFRSARAWNDQSLYEGSFRIDVIFVEGDRIVDHYKELTELTTA